MTGTLDPKPVSVVFCYLCNKLSFRGVCVILGRYTFIVTGTLDPKPVSAQGE